MHTSGENSKDFRGFSNLFAAALNIIYPSKCLVCARVLHHGPGLYACDSCLPSFNFVNEKIFGDFSFDDSFSFFEYNEALRGIIHDIKFGKKAHKMVSLTKQALALGEDGLDFSGIDAVVAVPLHPNRLRDRGFNQAHITAKILAQRLGVPLECSLCERIVDNAPQSRTDREGRRKNSENIFSLKNESIIYGKSFLLVDDIFTSGETLNSLASVFKKAGAKRISCVTLAISYFRGDSVIVD